MGVGSSVEQFAPGDVAVSKQAFSSKCLHRILFVSFADKGFESAYTAHDTVATLVQNRTVLVLICVASLIFFAYDYLVYQTVYTVLWAVRSGLIALCLLTLAFGCGPLRKGFRVMCAVTVFGCGITIIGTEYITQSREPSRTILVVAQVSLFLFQLPHLLVTLPVVLFAALYLAATLTIMRTPDSHLSYQFCGPLFVLTVLGAVMQFNMEYWRRRNYLAIREIKEDTEHLAEEETTNNFLLTNVLPVSILNEITTENAENKLVQRYDEVTVLFCLITGFAELKLPCDKTLNLLNALVTAFDDLLDDYKGVEKIKTIGPVYMAASGCPEKNPCHAADILELAFLMRDAVESFSKRENLGVRLQAQIGCNTGAVVGGIVGKKRFLFDIFGDTVNVASRLESNGIAGQVLISESTRLALHLQCAGRYVFERRNLMVKGKTHPLVTFLTLPRSANEKSKGKAPEWDKIDYQSGRLAFRIGASPFGTLRSGTSVSRGALISPSQAPSPSAGSLPQLDASAGSDSMLRQAKIPPIKSETPSRTTGDPVLLSPRLALPSLNRNVVRDPMSRRGSIEVLSLSPAFGTEAPGVLRSTSSIVNSTSTLEMEKLSARDRPSPEQIPKGILLSSLASRKKTPAEFPLSDGLPTLGGARGVGGSGGGGGGGGGRPANTSPLARMAARQAAQAAKKTLETNVNMVGFGGSISGVIRATTTIGPDHHTRVRSHIKHTSRIVNHINSQGSVVSSQASAGGSSRRLDTLQRGASAHRLDGPVMGNERRGSIAESVGVGGGGDDSVTELVASSGVGGRRSPQPVGHAWKRSDTLEASLLGFPSLRAPSPVGDTQLMEARSDEESAGSSDGEEEISNLERFALNKVTLAFKDSKVEADFRRRRDWSSMIKGRLLMLMCGAFFALMMGSDLGCLPKPAWLRLLLPGAVAGAVLQVVLAIITGTCISIDIPAKAEVLGITSFGCAALVILLRILIAAFVATPVPEATIFFPSQVMLTCAYLGAFSEVRFMYTIPPLLVFYAAFVGVCYATNAEFQLARSSTLESNSLPILISIALSVIASRFMESSARLHYSLLKVSGEAQEQALRIKAVSDRLLLNVLPPKISEMLKTQQEHLSLEFGSASILYCDIVGFTRFASDKSPQEVVTLLNSLFSTLDDLTDAFEVEKIKTIGDCYVAGSGMLNTDFTVAEAAVNLCRFALAIVDVVSRIGAKYELQVRVGVHTGAVAAGLVGRKKFLWDVWGSTVSEAEELESTGSPMRVHISADTYELVRDHFRCERQPVHRPGARLMNTYLLQSPLESTFNSLVGRSGSAINLAALSSLVPSKHADSPLSVNELGFQPPSDKQLDHHGHDGHGISRSPTDDAGPKHTPHETDDVSSAGSRSDTSAGAVRKGAGHASLPAGRRVQRRAAHADEATDADKPHHDPKSPHIAKLPDARMRRQQTVENRKVTTDDELLSQRRRSTMAGVPSSEAEKASAQTSPTNPRRAAALYEKAHTPVHQVSHSPLRSDVAKQSFEGSQHHPRGLAGSGDESPPGQKDATAVPTRLRHRGGDREGGSDRHLQAGQVGGSDRHMRSQCDSGDDSSNALREVHDAAPHGRRRISADSTRHLRNPCESGDDSSGMLKEVHDIGSAVPGRARRTTGDGSHQHLRGGGDDTPIKDPHSNFAVPPRLRHRGPDHAGSPHAETPAAARRDERAPANDAPRRRRESDSSGSTALHATGQHSLNGRRTLDDVEGAGVGDGTDGDGGGGGGGAGAGGGGSRARPAGLGHDDSRLTVGRRRVSGEADPPSPLPPLDQSPRSVTNDTFFQPRQRRLTDVGHVRHTQTEASGLVGRPLKRQTSDRGGRSGIGRQRGAPMVDLAALAGDVPYRATTSAIQR